MDIAALGLSIDSRSAVKAKGDLDALSASGAPTEKAFKRIETTSKGALVNTAKQTGLARHEMVNLSRQIQDVGTMLAMGASPFTILSSQGAQVFDIFSSSQGTFRGFVAQIRSMISPTMAITTGVAALGGAFYLANKFISDFALQLDDTRRIMGLTANEANKIDAAFSGIDAGDRLKGWQGIARATYDARNNMGELNKWFRANNLQAGDFAQNLENVRTLIRAASGDTEKQFRILQAAGLPATMQWVREMEKGQRTVKDLDPEFQKFATRARQAQESWNTFWTDFQQGGVRAVGAVLLQFDKLPLDKISAILSIITRGSGRGPAVGKTPNQIVFDRFPQVGEQFGSKPPDDPNVIANMLSLEQQRIGILGQLATVAQQVRQQEIAIRIARMNGVTITREEATALKNLTTAQFELSRIQEQAQIGIFESARAHENLNRQIQSAIDRGLLDPKNPAQMAAAYQVYARSLRETGEAARLAASQTPNLTRFAIEGANSMKQFDQFAVSGLTNFENSLADIVTGTKNVKDAFSDMVKSIMSDLARMVIRQQITAPLASALGGMFASHHTGWGPGDPIPRYHTGVGPGERPAIIRNDESVLTPGQLRAVRNMGSGGDTTVIVNNAPAGTQATATTSRDGRGNQRIEVTLRRMIDDTVASGIRSRESATHSAIKDTFGATDRM